MDQELRAAVEEMRRHVETSAAETRRHFDVVGEALRVDIRLVAEGVKRPSKVFQDIVAGGGGGLRILGLEGAVPIDGGLPLVMDGKIVGAIGLSGGTSDQDGQVAKAGADTLK